MSHFLEMDWNWENFVGFGPKATESPKKPRLADWMIDDDGEIDGGHVSSAKSSLSASTDSSINDPNFKLVAFDGFSENFSKNMESKGGTAVFGTCPHLTSSIGSGAEPLIGLKLGKRTYFENNGGGTNIKSAMMPTPSSTTSLKRSKSSASQIPCCIVEGCNIDLTMAKEYHRKHRVCDAHSKCPKVVVGGLERRFCQQCSRFHNLSEFDEKKRSCRRRLSDHNARRRKPQQETIQFNSARLSSPFYGERQQLSFLLKNSPLTHSRNSADTTWDSKFTLTKGYPFKSAGDGGIDEPMHMSGTKLPHVINTHGNNAQLFASKSPVSEILNPGFKGSLISSHLDAAPEYGRALSLLSKSTWNPCGPENTHMPPQYPIHENGTTQPVLHHNMIPEGVPLSSDLWLSGGHQSTNPRPQSFVSNSNFQEIQLFVTPYEAELYSSILN
ncbi:hypothetical protein OROGR_014965 [Orobanche gracilis]